MNIDLARHATAEAIGTALLVAVVVGSGITAQRLSPDDVGLAAARELDRDRRRARRADPRARTGLGRALQPGRHAGRPRARRYRNRRRARRTWRRRSSGACVGAMVANLMFELPAVTISTHTRSSGALWFSEVVATFGLLLVILGVVRAGRAQVAAFAVGGYIAAAYWFTSSTSFANPAVTIGRTLTEHLRRHRAEQRARRSSSRRSSARSSPSGSRASFARTSPPKTSSCPTTDSRELTLGGLHMPDHATSRVDQNLALRSASKRLADEFEGTFGARRSSCSSPRATTSSPTAPPQSTSSRSWPSGSHGNA